jgi:hypothetical protein
MKASTLVLLCLAMSPAIADERGGVWMPLKSEAHALAGVMCFKKGERVSGMNKICFYDCMGSAAAITIGAVELCPLTIEQ